MSRVSTNVTNAANNATPKKKVHDLNDLQADDFLQLMITELQQQDPLNPMDNKDMVQQINSIRELSATTNLTTTLNSVLVGQNLSTAGALIGKNVKALNDKAEDVTGKVERVSVTVDPKDDSKREIRVHIGTNSVKLTNIREVLP